MKRVLVLITSAVCFILLSCGTKSNLEVEKTQVQQVLDQFVQATDTEDMAMLEKLYAKDADLVVIGTDAAEWWVGWPAVKQAMEQQFAAFEQSKMTVKDQQIKLSVTGQVAWFAEKANVRIVSQGQTFESEFRFTGVLEKRNGHWLFVQSHVSIPVSGQAVAY